MSSTPARRVRRNSVKADLPPPPQVRELKDIQDQHNQLCWRAGAVQYQISVLKTELDTLNDLLIKVNQEAAARNELDKKVPAETVEENPGE